MDIDLIDLDLVLRLGVVIDIVGVFMLVTGLFLSVLIFFAEWFKEKSLAQSYVKLRQNLGRAILLGLEFLVAGDIIRSVGGENPTIQSIAILGLLVIIRTFLSFTFELEVNGKWPWQKKNS